MLMLSGLGFLAPGLPERSLGNLFSTTTLIGTNTISTHHLHHHYYAIQFGPLRLIPTQKAGLSCNRLLWPVVPSSVEPGVAASSFAKMVLVHLWGPFWAVKDLIQFSLSFFDYQ
jgi:hypothetical protein